ncbi:MAG: tetratricopeptide repeat protein [Planctomycetes bacterium]|nr:tetratricopeptide repeat protein [Planctomycetota bacterium]
MSNFRDVLHVAATVVVAVVAGVLVWDRLIADHEVEEDSPSDRARVRVEVALSVPEPLESAVVAEDSAGRDELLRLNRAALSSLRGKDYTAAVRDFRAALDLEPVNQTLLLNLSRALAQWGDFEMRRGRLQEALIHLEEAVSLHHDDGKNGNMLAYALLRTGRRDHAALVLDSILREYPDSIPALRLAGEVEFLRGELNPAVSYLERAAKLAPGEKSIEDRLTFYRSEQARLATYVRVQSTRFEAMYPAENAEIRPHLEALLLDLEEASNDVNALLGLAPTDRVLVLILPPEEYYASAPNWSNGLYDGRIRIPLSDYSVQSEHLRSTFRHEYTHAALHRVGPAVPTWLHEGLAQYVEGMSVDRARTVLRNQPGSMPSITRLTGDWTRLTDRTEVQGAYAYALSLAGWILEKYGADALVQLVSGLEFGGFEDAFRGSFGVQFDEVEAAHRAALLESR